MKNKVIKAIILAGGYSRRIGLKVPKQLAKIDNRPLLAYTLDAFERCRLVDSIILVVHKKIVQQCHTLIKKYRFKKIEQLVVGGRTRQMSVFNALGRIRGCDYVVIHDGVRPFVHQKMILEIIEAAKKFNAATCAVNAIDTIVEAKKGLLRRMLCRNELWHIQTPQAFKFDLIYKAHQRAKARGVFNASDDTQLALRLKNKIRVIEGSFQNLKITTPFDLYLAKLLLRNREGLCRSYHLLYQFLMKSGM